MSDRIDLHTKGKKAYDWASITKEPTGFVSPPEGEYTGVSYNSTTRKVTLSNLYGAYYHGEAIPELATGTYEIPLAHDESPTTTLFLKYNSNGFEWQTTPWNFDELQICYVCYKSTGTFCFAQREPHQFMPHSVHRELHYNIGTTRELHGGGLLTGYTPQSTTSTNRRPDIAECEVHDEDLPTLLPELTSKSYTRMYLSGASGSANFETAQTEIVSITGAIPNYNYWNGSTWGQAAMNSAQNTTYMSIWVIAVPVTDDAHSQAYRFIWMQGQSIGLDDTGLATQRALNPQDLTKGELSGISPEFVFIAQLILRYVPNPTNNWDIYEVRNIYGNKASQTGSPSGVFGDVFGPASSTDSTVALFNGTTGKSLKDGSNIYSNGTNVGIGAAPVSEKLEVSGTIKATDLRFDANNRVVPSSNLIEQYANGAGLSWNGSELFPNGDNVRSLGTLAKRFIKMIIGDGDSSIAGKLGIRTTTPGNALEVKNTATNTTAIAVQRSGGTQQVVRLGEDTNGRGLVRVLDDGANDKILLAADGDCYINPLNSGNLGVGTSSPSATLDVNGTIRAAGSDAPWTTINWGRSVEMEQGDIILWQKGATGVARGIGASSYGMLYVGRSTANDNSAGITYDMIIDKTGNVGLGTDPAEKLDVVSTGGTNVRIGGTALGDYGRILFRGNRVGSENTIGSVMAYNNQSGSAVLVSEIRQMHYGSSADNRSSMQLSTHNGTDLVTAMYVDATQKIGIGTTTPAEKLDVNGNAKAHSFIGSRKLYAAEAPNSYYGIQEDLDIETNDVDAYVDIALPANTAIAHIIVDVIVQHGSGTSFDYTAILDAWVHVSNDKVETTVRCANQTSEKWLTIDEALASGKVRIRLDGGTSGATNNRTANVRGQIVEYMEALT